MNLPERGKLISIIAALKKTDLAQVPYDWILNILKNELKCLPYPILKLKEGQYIERARINDPNQIFSSETEISYRSDFEKINEFGRANSPHQSLFYGAMESEYIEFPRVVNLFEISELYRNPSHKPANFLMTMGKWRIKEDFKVAYLAFNKQNIANIQSIKESYDGYISSYQNAYPKRIDDIDLVLEYFSDEFSKRDIQSHNDYKISVAYTDLAINYASLNGVVYPSVRTDFQGTNVALTIEAVDSYLTLEDVKMMRVYKKGKKTFLDNAFFTNNFGSFNRNFKWDKIQEQDKSYIQSKLRAD